MCVFLTFICQNVKTASDQRLCSFRTVFHQQQQLRGVHPHSTNLHRRKVSSTLKLETQ